MRATDFFSKNENIEKYWYLFWDTIVRSVHFNERFEGFLEVFGGGLEEKENIFVIGM